MRVQHPEKRQFEIAPAGAEPILTDERGIAEVPNAVGKDLVAQGWAKLKDAVKSTSSEPEAVAPAVEVTDDAAGVGEEK